MPILSNFPSGGGNTSDYATITFYDWDLSPLGSIVVPKGENAGAAVTAFENTLKATTFDEGSQYYSSDKSKPLTNKKGYSFGGVWLDYDDETVTQYGTCVEAANANNTFTIPTPTGVSFANIRQNMLVKAAYGSNDELVIDTPVVRGYTIEVVGYGKHGAASIYKIDLRIKRENANGQGVPRLRQAAMRVTYRTDDEINKQIVYPFDLKNMDEQVVTIPVSDFFKQVDITVIDIYEVYNAISGAGARSSVTIIEKGTPEEKTGFVFLGTMCAVNDYISSNGAYGQNITAAILRNNLGLDTTNPSTGTSPNTTTLRTYLTNAWRAKNPQWESENHPPFEDLTWDEMQYAIWNEGALMPKGEE